MSVPQINGISMTTKRRHTIFALYKLGGALETPKGKKFIPQELTLSKLDMTTGSLARLEQDGIIVRDMHGKMTRSITLTADWMKWAAENAPKKRGPYKRTTAKPKGRVGGKSNATAVAAVEELPLPTIGATLTVFMLQADQDGEVNIGLRNGSNSWLLAVRGHVGSGAE